MSSRINHLSAPAARCSSGCTFGQSTGSQCLCTAKKKVRTSTHVNLSIIRRSNLIEECKAYACICEWWSGKRRPAHRTGHKSIMKWNKSWQQKQTKHLSEPHQFFFVVAALFFPKRINVFVVCCCLLTIRFCHCTGSGCSYRRVFTSSDATTREKKFANLQKSSSEFHQILQIVSALTSIRFYSAKKKVRKNKNRIFLNFLIKIRPDDATEKEKEWKKEERFQFFYFLSFAFFFVDWRKVLQSARRTDDGVLSSGRGSTNSIGKFWNFWPNFIHLKKRVSSSSRVSNTLPTTADCLSAWCSFSFIFARYSTIPGTVVWSRSPFGRLWRCVGGTCELKKTSEIIRKFLSQSRNHPAPYTWRERERGAEERNKNNILPVKFNCVMNISV